MIYHFEILRFLFFQWQNSKMHTLFYHLTFEVYLKVHIYNL